MRQPGEAHGVGDRAIQRQARPGEVRRARQRHAAVGAELALDAADRVASRARMPAAAIASVTRIVRVRALRAHHRLHRRRRQVVAVDDQAREQRVGRELLPDDVRVPRQHLRAAVAEMRRQRRAGGDRVGDLLRRRRPCGRWRRARPRATRCSMSGTAPGTSGASVTSTMRPPAASWRRSKSSTLAGRDVRARMRAARAVFRRDVRTLHVDAGDRRIRHARRGRARSRRSRRTTT